MQILIGFLLAAAIAGLAYRLRTLTRSGAVAAVMLGTVVFGFGGLEWAILLMAFFGSSSGLTRAFARRKQELSGTFSKGGQRDAMQVFANGGLAGLFVIAHALVPGQSWPWLAYAGTLAAVNADTWATELGVLSPSLPRLITNFRAVPNGTSGGVTPTGTLASAGGAFWIAIFGAIFWPAGLAPRSEPLVVFLGMVTLAGLAGSLVDSLLGATLQAMFYCPACGRETERHPVHTCGTPTTRVRGLSWLNNDSVNLACAFTGGLLALLGVVF
jgi:uncharacterized protein (TIGR00297 family)